MRAGDLKGIGAGEGWAIAQAWILPENEDASVSRVAVADPEKELARLSAAIDKAATQLSAIADKVREQAGDKEAAVFEAHELILKDPELLAATQEIIKSESVCAEWAISEAAQTTIHALESLDDPYLRERAVDVRDVVRRVLILLQNREVPDLSSFDHEVIVLASELTPSEVALLDREQVQGLIFSQGSATSHAVLIAQSMGIPCAAGIGDAGHEIKSGEWIALDGKKGRIWKMRDQMEISEFQDRRKVYLQEREELKNWIQRPSRTADDRELSLGANVMGVEESVRARESGADGVGLFRTEFLFIHRSEAPTENEQFEVYRSVLQKMDGRLAVIRTLDAGGDKPVPYLNLKNEENPMLGHRAIRLCLKNPDLFKTQFRALMRAGVYGNLAVMLPMVSQREEIVAAKKLIAEAKKELQDRGEKFTADFQLGIMIEIPAAAVMSEVLAQEVDFFSVGTNDLTQYTCAADRNNEAVRSVFNEANPGVLKLIEMSARSAEKAGIWIGVCGAMASRLEFLPFFLGIGISELSMVHSQIPRVRRELSRWTVEDAKRFTKDLLALGSTTEVDAFVSARYAERPKS